MHAWIGQSVIGVAAILAALGGCSSSDFQPATGGAGNSTGTGGSDGGGGAPDGTACSTSQDCQSGHCIDGVCCDTSCAGSCETCASSGKEGKCSPWSAGVDPDGDCSGDAGDPCSGSCDGNGACAYPDKGKPCGTTTCSAGTQDGPACDGAGACTPASTPCGLFLCGATSCLTNCGSDANCVTNAWCSAGTCLAKKSNGADCSADGECTSGTCALGHCCAGPCNAPSSCDTGECLCGGASCGSGDPCVLWYADKDVDLYGDPNDSLPGCASTAPTAGGCSQLPCSRGTYPYWKDNTDCYDDNYLAHPGQTLYFDTDRGDGSFDYDCNNIVDKKYPLLTGNCVSCGTCAGTTTCSERFGFACSGSCPSVQQGFGNVVACGEFDTMSDCSANGTVPSCTPSVTTQQNTQQICR